MNLLEHSWQPHICRCGRPHCCPDSAFQWAMLACQQWQRLVSDGGHKFEGFESQCLWLSVTGSRAAAPGPGQQDQIQWALQCLTAWQGLEWPWYTQALGFSGARCTSALPPGQLDKLLSLRVIRVLWCHVQDQSTKRRMMCTLILWMIFQFPFTRIVFHMLCSSPRQLLQPSCNAS